MAAICIIGEERDTGTKKNTYFKDTGASSQDGGIGRYAVPPCTTKRRTTTNLKTKSNQNCQKTKLYGSLTTKKLKKKHLSRLVGGEETGSRAERTHGKVVAGGLGWGGSSWQSGWSGTCVQINQEEQLGSETDHATQGSNAGK